MLFEHARFALFAGLVVGLSLSVTACSDQWNTPYDAEQTAANTLFSAFSAPPKHLDPVRAYSSNEWGIIAQILEPPLQYHYLKRPYTLEQLTLTQMPTVRYFNAVGAEVKADSADIAYSEFILHIKPDIAFQPHPAFVKNEQGEFVYAQLTDAQTKRLKSPFELPQSASRTLTADDYANAIKRMAGRKNHSPILDTMMEYIVGLKDFSEQITKQRADAAKDAFFDLRPYDIEGVKVVNEHELHIRLHGVYPQF